MKIFIRSATPRDAADLLWRMDIAGQGIEAEAWAGQRDDEQSVLSAARYKILTDESKPHHCSKVWIVGSDGAVADLLVGERVAEPQEVRGDHPDCFRPRLELESAVAGYWTVVAVAVYREF